MIRSSHRKTAAGVAKKVATRGRKKRTATHVGLRMTYCAPSGFALTGLPRGTKGTLEWDSHRERWLLTVGGIAQPLTTLFLSPRSAKENPKRFALEAQAHILAAMGAGQRTAAEQKGPLALGVR